MSSISLVSGLAASREKDHPAGFIDTEPRIELRGENWRLGSSVRLAPRIFESPERSENDYHLWLSELNICARNSPSVCLGRMNALMLWKSSPNALSFLGSGVGIDGAALRLGPPEEDIIWDLHASTDARGSFFMGLSALERWLGWQVLFAHRRVESGLLGEFAPDGNQFLAGFGVRVYDEVSVALVAGKSSGWRALSGLRARSSKSQTEKGRAAGENPIDMRVLAQTLYGFDERFACGFALSGLSQIRTVQVEATSGRFREKKLGTSAMGLQFLTTWQTQRFSMEISAGVSRKSEEELISPASFTVSKKSGYSSSLLVGASFKSGIN